MASGPLDEAVEARTAETNAERKLLREQEELFAIFRACDALERAYIKDAVRPAEYTAQCSRLIGQFEEQRKVLAGMGALGASGEAAEVRRWLAGLGVALPAAEKRLLVERVPATAFHGGGHDSGGGAGLMSVAVDVTGAMITAMDAAMQPGAAVDELVPHLRLASEALAQYPHAPPDFESRLKYRHWLEKLGGMRAIDVLSDDDRRQLRLDLEMAFEAWRALTKRVGQGGGGMARGGAGGSSHAVGGGGGGR